MMIFITVPGNTIIHTPKTIPTTEAIIFAVGFSYLLNKFTALITIVMAPKIISIQCNNSDSGTRHASKMIPMPTNTPTIAFVNVIFFIIITLHFFNLHMHKEILLK